MTRIHPRRLSDVHELSRLFDTLLRTLHHSPLATSPRELAWLSGIPEPVLLRLAHLHQNPAGDPDVRAADYHIAFQNVLFRFPTVRLYQTRDGAFVLRL